MNRNRLPSTGSMSSAGLAAAVRLAWLGLLGSVATDCVAADARPHVVIVLADDLGYGDLGCYGGPVPTPELDRMAREGIRFTRAYVAAPICSPSRCGLITGQFPARHRITSYLQTRAGNRECEQVDFLDPAAVTLPRVFQTAGYATAHVGKWHLGGGRDVDAAPPLAAYGYDRGWGTWESPEPHPDLTATDWIWSPQDKVPRWDRTAWMVDRTLDALREAGDRPALVNLWLDDTHTPWVPRPEGADATSRASRGAAANDAPAKPPRAVPETLRPVLMEMDRQLGRLLAACREPLGGRAVLIVFLGDNGPLPTFEGRRTAGLRGSKLSLYEGGVRVPLLAWCPGRVAAGRVDDSTVLAAVDLLPTLAAVAGVPLPTGYEPDGEDLSGALGGTPVARRGALYWEYGRNGRSFAFPNHAPDRSPALAVREGRWKLLVNPDGSGAELYDLESDPREKRNRADDEPAVVARLRSAVLAWRATWPQFP